jgi:hypothetical protein
VVAEFRDHPLGAHRLSYVFLDATSSPTTGALVVSKAIVIATGVSRTGDREVLGHSLGDSCTSGNATAVIEVSALDARSGEGLGELSEREPIGRLRNSKPTELAPATAVQASPSPGDSPLFFSVRLVSRRPPKRLL